MSEIQALAERLIRDRHEAIEAMCEAMLTHDLGGVLVTDCGINWTMQLSPDVPWGEIHYRTDYL